MRGRGVDVLAIGVGTRPLTPLLVSDWRAGACHVGPLAHRDLSRGVLKREHCAVATGTLGIGPWGPHADGRQPSCSPACWPLLGVHTGPWGLPVLLGCDACPDPASLSPRWTGSLFCLHRYPGAGSSLALEASRNLAFPFSGWWGLSGATRAATSVGRTLCACPSSPLGSQCT